METKVIYCVIRCCDVCKKLNVYLNTPTFYDDEDYQCEFIDDETMNGIGIYEIMSKADFAEISEIYNQTPCDPNTTKEEIVQKMEELGFEHSQSYEDYLIDLLKDDECNGDWS